MFNWQENLKKQQGLSLVELLVVITIVVLVGTLAIMQFGSSREQLKRQNVSIELKNAFERARFDSVKRRVNSSNLDQHAKVVITENSVTLKTDKNNNTLTTDSTDANVNNFSGQNISITGVGSMTFPVTVIFNQRGEVTAVDNLGASVQPAFIVCNGSCNATNDTNANANIILVTRTGTVNMLGGGSDIPTFSPPAVNAIPSNNQIRTDVTLP